MSGVGSQVIHFFESKGLSKAAAAGIVGNMKQESSLNVHEPGGGLIQGQGGRTSGGSLSQQLNGVWHELNTGYRSTLNGLHSARTPEEAARIFSKEFERPGTPMLANREAYAREAYGGKGLAGSTAGGEAALPKSRSTGVGSLPTASRTEQTEVENPKAKGIEALKTLLRAEKGSSENPLLTSGVLDKAAAPLIKTTTIPGTPSQAGGTGPESAATVPREGSLGQAPTNPNLHRVPPPVQVKLPGYINLEHKIKQQVEAKVHHPVSLKEAERDVGYGHIEAPGGKVVKTQTGPVYVPHKVSKSPLHNLTGQAEVGAPLPGKKHA